MRRLIDMSRFNDASRGVLGAVKILPRIILRDFVTFSAIMVMVALLGTAPFVQQTIQTRPCQSLVAGATSSLPVARNVTKLPGLNGVQVYNQARLVSA